TVFLYLYIYHKNDIKLVRNVNELQTCALPIFPINGQLIIFHFHTVSWQTDYSFNIFFILIWCIENNDIKPIRVTQFTYYKLVFMIKCRLHRLPRNSHRRKNKRTNYQSDA